MGDKFMSMQNLGFTLASRQSRHLDGAGDIFNGHTPKTMDMVFKAARQIAKNIMHPMFEEMDRQPPVLEKGGVHVHPRVRPMLETLGRDGWISAPFPEDWGGENMPASLVLCINFIFASANYSASVYAGLTMGAAKLLVSFGSKALQQTFVPPMLAGKWQGTMALTEPEAGSSLGDLTTAAIPREGGHYHIRGEKVFISAGDHDGVDNVVHLLLARIEGAGPGVKGISLFCVPKLRPEGEGRLVPNDVSVTQVFHKLGYRGAPITGLSFGENCVGYLVGQPHKGLSYMFQMMNNARLEVGMGATAIGSAAYFTALDHCRTRRQGRPLSAPRGSDPVPIIRHPDVRRMLLFQRAVVEGALCLILQCGMYEDIHARDPGQRDCHLLLELLTPVAKTYPSEMGILSTSAAIQCLGGYGYCDDFPVAQHFRDMRIHPIHEGTTGIQAMDLLGRKMVMEEGRAFQLLKQEIGDALERARTQDGPGRDYPITRMARELESALARVEKAGMALGRVALENGPDPFLADAALFLEMFGTMVIAWQWLTMACAASRALAQDRPGKKKQAFFEGKYAVAQYFFTYELPRVDTLAAVLEKSGQMTWTMNENWFTD